MPLNYGLPGGQPDPGVIKEITEANLQLLGQVGYDAGLGVINTLTTNESQLDLARDKLRRSLAGQTGAIARRSGPVREALAAQLGATVASNGVLLAAVPQSGPGGFGEGAGAEGCAFGDAIYYNLYLGSDGRHFSVEVNAPQPASGANLCSTTCEPATLNEWLAGSGPTALCPLPVPGEPPPPIGEPPPPPPPPEPIPCPTCCCCPCTCAVPPKKPPPEPPPEPPMPTPSVPALPAPLVLPTLPQTVQCVRRPDGSYPEVGSPEWCACLDGIRAWFADLGQKAASFLLVTGAEGAANIGFLAKTASSLFGIIGLDFPGANLVEQLSAGVIARIRDVWAYLQQSVISAPLCNPLELLGIALARAIAGALKHVHLGTDLGIWATAEITLTIPQLEAILDYASHHACPVEIPAPGEAIECLLQGTASEQQVRCWLAMRGVSLDVWWPVVQARREKLTIPELIQALRRAGVSEAEQTAALTRRGFLRPEEAAARVDLYDELPTVSDFLHFLVRNVFDKDYVRDYGLMEGFEERFWLEYGPSLRAIGMTREWAAEHYAAHWVNPAPTQMQEFVYRLRPGKEGVANPFTVEDYRRLLAEQDVAPFAAARFQETIYRVPALGYLRDMFRQGIISPEQLISYHQDLGYTKEDSEHFLDIDTIQRDRMRATQGHGWNPAAIAKGYIAGTLSAGEVRQRMGSLGYNDEEAGDLMARATSDVRYSIVTRARSREISAAAASVRQAQLAGVMDVVAATQNLRQLGYPESMARGIALAAEASQGVELVKRATQRVKRALLSGEVPVEYARSALGRLGIDSAAAQRFLLAWQVENTPGRRRRTSNQIVSDVAGGAMDTGEALVRLANLGYQDADSRLFLADAARRIVQRQAKVSAAGQREARSQARQLQGIRKEALRQAREAQSRLRRLSPVAKLQKWVGQNIVSKAFFYSRMGAMGYGSTDTDRYYAEACAKKGATCEEAPAGAPPTHNGSAGSTPAGGPAG